MTDTTTKEQESLPFPHDKDIMQGEFRRNWRGRTIVAGLIGLLVVLAPAVIGYQFNFNFGFIGLAIGLWLLGLLFPYITVIVPLWQGLVTNNIFGGTPVTYGPGLHPRYFWEEVHATGHLPLAVVTKTITETIATQTDELSVRFTFQFAASLPHLKRLFGIAPSTIENGLKGIILNYFSAKLAEMTASDARSAVVTLSNSALRVFKLPEKGGEDELNEEDKETFEAVRGFRQLYGIELMLIRIDDMDFSEEVQAARGAKAAAKPILEVAAELANKDPDDVERAMIMAGKGTFRKITVGGSVGHTIAAAVANLTGGDSDG